MPSNFHIRIRELRAEAFGTQEKFAYHAGVSRATVQNWERGTFQPNLSQAARLADIFGVSLDFLAGRSDARGGGRGVQPSAIDADGQSRLV